MGKHFSILKQPENNGSLRGGHTNLVKGIAAYILIFCLL